MPNPIKFEPKSSLKDRIAVLEAQSQLRLADRVAALEEFMAEVKQYMPKGE